MANSWSQELFLLILFTSTSSTFLFHEISKKIFKTKRLKIFPIIFFILYALTMSYLWFTPQNSEMNFGIAYLLYASSNGGVLLFLYLCAKLLYKKTLAFIKR